MNRVPFEELMDADLVVGAIYEGVRLEMRRTIRWPGFFLAATRRLPDTGQRGYPRLPDGVALHLGADPDWPDALDVETGLFTYFGDNKSPGREPHRTARGGNELLRFAFEAIHGTPPQREVLVDSAKKLGVGD
jgi:hypothetical protein